MAFGSGSRSFDPDSVIYSFAIKTKGLPAPTFYVSKKNADGKYELIKNADGTPKAHARVSGDIISASPKKGQHEGKDIHSINLTIQDKKDIYFVSVGETFLGRNLYNSLLSLNVFDDIEIGLYQSKPKPGAPNQKGYASVALRQHNELVKGLFDPKGTEMPKVKKVRVKGEDISDTEELDLWFRAKMAEWCKKVNAANKAAESQHEEVPAGHTEGDDNGAEAGNGDPF